MIRALAHVLSVYWLRIALALRLSLAAHPNGSLLVLAPHPDDEILGVGGCILAALQQGQAVHIVYLTDGEAACPQYPAEQVKAERGKLTCEVMQQLDIPPQHRHYLHMPDGDVPHRYQAGFDEAAERIRELVDCLKPENLLATHRADFWPYDHVACAELAEAAIASATHKPSLYSYWVWAWYHMRPWKLLRKWPSGLIAVDISPWSADKRRLAQAYLNTKSPSGKPWSGVLPWSLRQAFNFNIEVLEEVTANE